MTRNLSDTCYHRKTKYTKAQAEAIILEKASSLKLYLYECGICGACHLSKQKPRDLPAGGPDCSGSELSSPADGVDLPIASSPDSARSSLNNSIDAEFSEMANDEPYQIESKRMAEE